MPTLKAIKPVLNRITKNNTRPIIKNVLVKANKILVTDFETNIIFKDNFDLSEGLHDVKTIGLLKGNNNEEVINEFPAHIFFIDSINFEGSTGNTLYMNDFFEMSLELIEILLPFSSKDETRLKLNGIAINNGHFVACDGYTLKTVELANKVDNDYIIPRTSLELLVKLLKKYKITSDFKCSVNEEYFLVDNEFFTFSAKLIKRDYPKWNRIVPTKFAKSATIDQWIDYKELKPLINKRTKASRLEFKGGEVTLIITGYENNKYIVGKCDENLDDTLGFNLEYLNKAAGKSKSFNIKFNNELCPTMINDAIVMPMKI